MVAHNKLIPAGFPSSGWTPALILGVVALGANGSSSTAATLTSALASSSSKTIVVNRLDVNPSGAAIIPAPGTKQGVVSEGDELIVNDQLTVTTKRTAAGTRSSATPPERAPSHGWRQTAKGRARPTTVTCRTAS